MNVHQQNGNQMKINYDKLLLIQFIISPQKSYSIHCLKAVECVSFNR